MLNGILGVRERRSKTLSTIPENFPISYFGDEVDARIERSIQAAKERMKLQKRIRRDIKKQRKRAETLDWSMETGESLNGPHMLPTLYI